MSFSFIDIEEKKSKVILLLFISIILLYFLTAYVLLFLFENLLFPSLCLFGCRAFPPVSHAFAAFLVALVLGAGHATMSVSGMVPKIARVAGARELDEKDTYHRLFRNIVEEVGVALGGKKIEPMVIPSSSMNAFALQDFKGRSVIGVTEGLLARLNRSQIEAVVAHEAGHIANGDSLTSSVLCSLGEIYEETVSRTRRTLSRSRGGVLMLSVYLWLTLMHVLNKLMRSFVSREREYRSDVVAVRLTRNPLALAEALMLIARGWKGEGDSGEYLQSIFIMNPRFDSLDERQGPLSWLFSTHPPVSKRVALLLSMAHLDEKALEENLRSFKRVSPVAQALFAADEQQAPKQWRIYLNNVWQGPFGAEALAGRTDILPEQWVQVEGEHTVKPAYEDSDLKALFWKTDESSGTGLCPQCRVPLGHYQYEGAPVLQCRYCSGVFARGETVSRILVRRDYTPSEDVIRLSELVLKSKEKMFVAQKGADPKSAWVLACPQCGRPMLRQFFVYSYPVEVDRCASCSATWFEKDELEVLQYLYEHKEKLY
jgi:heat shock protein HtpX